MEEGIFGIQPIAFFGLVLGIILIGWLVWMSMERSRNAKAVVGHILCEFYTRSGNCYEVLCEEVRGQVKPPKAHQKLKIDASVKAPQGHMVERYFVIPDFTFNTLYPKNKNKNVQVTVRKTTYLENDPMPKITFKPEIYDENREKAMTAALVQAAQDENTARSIIDMSKDVFDDLKTVATNIKKISTIFYISLGTIGGLAVLAILIVQLSSQLKILLASFGLG